MNPTDPSKGPPPRKEKGAFNSTISLHRNHFLLLLTSIQSGLVDITAVGLTNAIYRHPQSLLLLWFHRLGSPTPSTVNSSPHFSLVNGPMGSSATPSTGSGSPYVSLRGLRQRHLPSAFPPKQTRPP